MSIVKGVVASRVNIESVDYEPQFYSLDDLCGASQNWAVTTRHTEIAMKRLSVDTQNALPPSIALPDRRRLHEIRFVAGIAIALGGAGVLLSDLAHHMPSLG